MRRFLCCLVILFGGVANVGIVWGADCNCSFMSTYVPGYSFDVAFETNFGTLKEGFFQLEGGQSIATCACIEGQTRNDCHELWEQGTGGGVNYVNDSELCTWMQPGVGSWSCENTGCYDE